MPLSRLSNLSMRLQTVQRLGLVNTMDVLVYRGRKRLGLMEKQLPIGESYKGTFFQGHLLPSTPENLGDCHELLAYADALLEGNIPYYEHVDASPGSPPRWTYHPTRKEAIEFPAQHWSRLEFFDDRIGDIKNMWELSRMGWILPLAQAFRLTGDDRYRTTLNQWLSDWVEKNPWNQGVNWLCAQEASIRIFHLFLGSCLLGELHQPTCAVIRFLHEHLLRIVPTVRYARAQDNNHGTSEAAALFLGGAWLTFVTKEEKEREEAFAFYQTGRAFLEERVGSIFEEDGTFSQYSVNYHRVALKTLCIAEIARRNFAKTSFSTKFYQRAQAATHWLFSMVEPSTGEVPNLGHNDGARLGKLSETGYRDFREVVQLASVLFSGKPAFGAGKHDQAASWLGLSTTSEEMAWSKQSYVFANGGYVAIHKEHSWGVIRFPRFRFRPSHADALHLDLWVQGVNLLRDGGSYSYNTDAETYRYFTGTESHNTISFDGREQMPRISRFLFGDWLADAEVSSLEEADGSTTFMCSYEDAHGCQHKREIIAASNHWMVIDSISGFQENAVLRWRLCPDFSWKHEDMTCFCDVAKLSISSDRPSQERGMIEGWESRFYLDKTSLPVFEVKFGRGTTRITTEISFGTKV